MSDELDRLLRSLPHPGQFDGKLDAMAAPLFEQPSGGKGRFIVRSDGTVVPAPESRIVVPNPAILSPGARVVRCGKETLVFPAVVTPTLGPTRVGEYLMVDIRTAKAIPGGTRLHKICSRLSRSKGCGVVESTLVIDLLVASRDERRFLLCPTNWPKPGGPDDEDGPGGA
jgi:hypothetical protein